MLISVDIPRLDIPRQGCLEELERRWVKIVPMTLQEIDAGTVYALIHQSSVIQQSTAAFEWCPFHLLRSASSALQSFDRKAEVLLERRRTCCQSARRRDTKRETCLLDASEVYMPQWQGLLDFCKRVRQVRALVRDQPNSSCYVYRRRQDRNGVQTPTSRD